MLKLARLRHPHSHDYGLQVHLQTHCSTTSKFTWLWPTKFILKLAQWWPPSASLTSHGNGLQLLLWVHSTAGSKYIFRLTLSQPSCASPHSIDHGLQAHLWVYTITVWWNGGVHRQRAHHQHTSAPLPASHRNSFDIVDPARGVEVESERICEGTRPELATHIASFDEHSARVGGNQGLRNIACVFCCMLWWCLSTLWPSQYVLCVVQSVSITLVPLYVPCRLPSAKWSGGCGEEWILLPQWPPCPLLHSLNWHVQVLIWLLLTTVCSQTDIM